MYLIVARWGGYCLYLTHILYDITRQQIAAGDALGPDFTPPALAGPGFRLIGTGRLDVLVGYSAGLATRALRPRR